jgi:hypothetical protein
MLFHTGQTLLELLATVLDYRLEVGEEMRCRDLV